MQNPGQGPPPRGGRMHRRTRRGWSTARRMRRRCGARRSARRDARRARANAGGAAACAHRRALDDGCGERDAHRTRREPDPERRRPHRRARQAARARRCGLRRPGFGLQLLEPAAAPTRPAGHGQAAPAPPRGRPLDGHAVRTPQAMRGGHTDQNRGRPLDGQAVRTHGLRRARSRATDETSPPDALRGE